MVYCRDPLAQFEVEKREHEIKMRKMEQEMEEVFEMKVQEKLQKLKDIEADVSPPTHSYHTDTDTQHCSSLDTLVARELSLS